ncbi:MAG TPA: sensor histidine kinase [Thermoanaerobacterales bacterium]|nr:sensor histidine kinase [Thermoanaerobacterales bacterium]
MISKIKKSFGGKLFIFFLIIGIQPLLFMTAAAYINTNQMISEKINSSIYENVKIVGNLLDSSLETFLNMARFISHSDDVKTLLNKEWSDGFDSRFIDVQKVYKLTNLLTVAHKNEVPVYIVGVKKYNRFSTTDHLPPIYATLKGEIFNQIDMAAKNETIYTQRRFDASKSKDIVLTLGRKICDDASDEILGYVILDIYDEYFDKVLDNVKVFEGNNVYVLDKNGVIITDKQNKNMTGFKFYDEYYNMVMNNEEGKFSCNIQNIDCMAFFTTLPNTGFKMVEIIPSKILYGDKRVIIKSFIIIALIFSLISIGASLFLSKNLSRPINYLSGLMKKVEKGDMDVKFDLKRDDEIGLLGDSFNKMIKKTKDLIDKVYIKQYLLKEAEFKELKSQANPHFIYNTLESINCMARLKDYEGITDMVTALGKFLRYSLNKDSDMVTIKEDIEQVKNYLTIQQIRFGDKIKINFDVDERLYDKKILKFLIQPLVENAIIHGLEPKIGKGFINIKGYIKDDLIVFDIEDDGVGFGRSPKPGFGLGMKNVDKLVKIHYGKEYGLSIPENLDITCVRLTIPNEE